MTGVEPGLHEDVRSVHVISVVEAGLILMRASVLFGFYSLADHLGVRMKTRDSQLLAVLDLALAPVAHDVVKLLVAAPLELKAWDHLPLAFVYWNREVPLQHLVGDRWRGVSFSLSVKGPLGEVLSQAGAGKLMHHSLSSMLRLEAGEHL